jgi:hypothetical protein
MIPTVALVDPVLAALFREKRGAIVQARTA